jgi:hypothetical protein
MSRDINFPGRQPDEKIVIVLHRHWFVFVRHVFILILIAGVPPVVALIWSQIATFELVSGSLSHTLLVMGAALYYIFLWILMYGFWLDYYLDIFIITDKRIVDIEQDGLFGRTVAEERLYRIQDVTSDAQGIMATTLHFGNVYVQTAGKTERFIFEQVAHPESVARTILELTDKIVDRLEDDHDEHHRDDAAADQHQTKTLGK